MLARVASWLDEQTGATGRWLVIADGSVLRAIILHVLGAPPASFWRFDLPPLSRSVIQSVGSQWRLRSLAHGADETDTLGHTSTGTIAYSR